MSIIEWKGLEPLSLQTCDKCQNSAYDIEKGFYCRKHKDLKIEGVKRYEVVECDDYLTPMLTDYRRRYDLESQLKKTKN